MSSKTDTKLIIYFEQAQKSANNNFCNLSALTYHAMSHPPAKKAGAL
jgi:hypothetical protein